MSSLDARAYPTLRMSKLVQQVPLHGETRPATPQLPRPPAPPAPCSRPLPSHHPRQPPTCLKQQERPHTHTHTPPRAARPSAALPEFLIPLTRQALISGWSLLRHYILSSFGVHRRNNRSQITPWKSWDWDFTPHCLLDSQAGKEKPQLQTPARILKL